MREGEEKGDLATFFFVKQDNFFKLIIFFSTNCDDDGFQMMGVTKFSGGFLTKNWFYYLRE